MAASDPLLTGRGRAVSRAAWSGPRPPWATSTLRPPLPSIAIARSGGNTSVTPVRAVPPLRASKGLPDGMVVGGRPRARAGSLTGAPGPGPGQRPEDGLGKDGAPRPG